MSYRTLPNIGQKISGHNKKIIRENLQAKTEQKLCNCRVKCECPAGSMCLLNGVIYQATVKNLEENLTETYVGLTANNFKTRLANHKKSFNFQKYRNDTCLSTHIWDLKDKNKRYSIEWKILDKGTTYDPSTNRCNLCLKEKFQISWGAGVASLNSRTEMWKQCIHKNKLLISNFTKSRPPDPDVE